MFRTRGAIEGSTFVKSEMTCYWIRLRHRQMPRLCFTRSDGAVSVGLAGGLGPVCRSFDLLRGKIGHRGLGHAAEGLAGRLGANLAVGCNVEGDEEYQVRGEDTHARESGELLTGALASIWPVGLVGGNEVRVRGEVDESCAWLGI